MFKDLIRHINLIISNLFLDINEQKFLQFNQKNFKEKKNLKKEYILVQVVTDYYYLAYYKTLFLEKKFENFEVVGLWPYFQRTIRKRNFFLEIFNELYLYILDYIIYLKWRRLYKSIGINSFERLNVTIFERINFIFKNKFLNSFNDKKNIFDYEIANIKLGDLLYDTYLRYRAQPTLMIKDKSFLKKLITKSNLIVFKLQNLINKYQFLAYYTSYSSYIHHGLPVRFFINKGITVFSGKNNSQYNKKLSLADNHHTENYLIFKELSTKIKKDQKCLDISSEDLRLRFSNNQQNNMSYLKVDTYNSKKNNKLNLDLVNNLDGVLFLQDFFDSPHSWAGEMIFDNFYKWTVFTLNIIKKNNLKIGVKPHPNSWHKNKDTILLYQRLKKKFPDIVWIDKDFPNKIIFNKIKYGISCRGTVLFELAYHGIKSVSCGDHPGKDFNFTIHANSKIEYKNILLNIKNFKTPEYSKNDLLAYNYLYYHHNSDSYLTLARRINLKKIDFSDSNGLKNFIKKIKSYDNKH